MDELQIRHHLINRFINLYLGDLPEIYTMPLDHLESMVETLERAQAAGELDLETTQGVKNLQAIIDPYLTAGG